MTSRSHIGVFTRRRLLLASGAGTLLAVAGSAYALVDSGKIPGKSHLDIALGRCDLDVGRPTAEPGLVRQGSFDSKARRKPVGYRVVYPPGASVNDRVPVCLVLHGYGGDARGAIDCGEFDRQVAARVAGGGRGFALASCDGGGGYWHPHPDDDPLGALLDEFLPLLASFGLAAGDHDRVGVLGTSMGGYGALVCALTRPERFAAVAASAPAFWRSFQEARRVNPGAFGSSDEWRRYDVLARAGELGKVPLRIDCGQDDVFAPAVSALRDRLADPLAVHFAKGCHTGEFWRTAAPAQIAFIGEALKTS